MDSFTGWLEALRGCLWSSDSQATGVESDPDGTVIARSYFGTVTNVCQASVDLCKLQESLALETERMADLREQQVRDLRPLSPLPFAQGPTSSTEPDPPAPQESVADQLKRLREESRLTVEQLAERVGINMRTVQRHLADDSDPYARHLTAYERVFSKLLKHNVIIRKMP
jgi:DNA-binding XRE family transcriptional regulator